ncbi:MAG: bifunctional methylenetetrahydrofolate dehydrogenase/methenyltetrahydrofolate cyclohydrolase [Nitrospirae bacterium]|nr:bifunctional methylenetetrahydrofolate dehydrogenase/methenyltetrahydrofolate cyclohydrolase [Nitrospirota bacterium]
MADILDGKTLAERIKQRVRREVASLNKDAVDVGLGVLLTGDNPASVQYYKTTLGACRKTGITAYEFRFADTVSLNELLNSIHAINRDERIHGLLMLMPLPARINARRVINTLVPEKDIDGLGSISVGRLSADESTIQIIRQTGANTMNRDAMNPAAWSFLPCTPFGVIRLLEHYKVPIRGRHVVIIGKSLAVGKPLSMMFLAKEATVTVCHRETRDLGSMTRQADILCSATGKAALVTGDMVKRGAVVVDVGINMLQDGTMTGDVDFRSVARKASLITPVPGGVGPVTVAMLLENTARSARRFNMLHPSMTLA